MIRIRYKIMGQWYHCSFNDKIKANDFWCKLILDEGRNVMAYATGGRDVQLASHRQRGNANFNDIMKVKRL